MVTVSDKGNGFEKEHISEGDHHAVCCAIWDLGFQKNTFDTTKPAQHKIVIAWEVDEVYTQGKFVYMRKVITAKYTASLNKKSNLTTVLQGWRGKAFTEEERAGFDLDKILGAPCTLNITHTYDAAGVIDKASINSVGKVRPAHPKWKARTMDIPKWLQEAIDGQVPDPCKVGAIPTQVLNAGTLAAIRANLEVNKDLMIQILARNNADIGTIPLLDNATGIKIITEFGQALQAAPAAGPTTDFNKAVGFVPDTSNAEFDGIYDDIPF